MLPGTRPQQQKPREPPSIACSTQITCPKWHCAFVKVRQLLRHTLVIATLKNRSSGSVKKGEKKSRKMSAKQRGRNKRGKTTHSHRLWGPFKESWILCAEQGFVHSGVTYADFCSAVRSSLPFLTHRVARAGGGIRIDFRRCPHAR